MKRWMGFVFALTVFAGLALSASANMDQAKESAPASPGADPQVLARGKTIYDARCKACHRSDGKGTMDEMDLTDSVWNHGGTAEAIEKVIREGIKETGMRPIPGDYSDADIKALVKYVLAFSANAPPAAPAPPTPPPPPQIR